MITNSWRFAFKFAWVAFCAARERKGTCRYTQIRRHGMLKSFII